ncbi:hypothetical protein ACB094_12G175500 [Castanea mollissima]
MAMCDECKLKFLELKAKRNLEAQMKPEDFAESLPANGCHYAVYDLYFITDEDCQKSKIFFTAW